MAVVLLVKYFGIQIPKGSGGQEARDTVYRSYIIQRGLHSVLNHRLIKQWTREVLVFHNLPIRKSIRQAGILYETGKHIRPVR